MSSKRKLLLIVCFCILDVLLLSGYVVLRKKTMVRILKKEEIKLLSSQQLGTSISKIQTRGKYRVVEKAIKDYLSDYSKSFYDIMGIKNDSNLTSILSYDNYVKDGPDFITSLQYLEDKKKDFNGKVDSFLLKSDDSMIEKGITSKLHNSYYIDLYNDFMLDQSLKSQLTEKKDIVIELRDQMNQIFDTSNEVLHFLIENKDSWKVEDGQIQFLTEDLYNQYIFYVSKIAL